LSTNRDLKECMTRVTITELNYKFRKIERMLQTGEEIQIAKRNKVIAKMRPKRENPLKPRTHCGTSDNSSQRASRIDFKLTLTENHRTS
jgi:antitoxin (DNA-binding transcriptional repressor) of toxin-antitoxin stability system